MNIKVNCKTCGRQANRVLTHRDVIKRGVVTVVRCHGQRAELFVPDMAAHEAYTAGQDLILEAFAKPVMIIIDRDTGDEDPNEPIQGPTCQM